MLKKCRLYYFFHKDGIKSACKIIKKMSLKKEFREMECAVINSQKVREIILPQGVGAGLFENLQISSC